MTYLIELIILTQKPYDLLVYETKNTKIIAREFLIVMLALTISIIFFLCTYPYNKIKRTQLERISIQMFEKSKKAYYLSLPYENKLNRQNWLYYKYSYTWDFGGEKNSSYKLWKYLDHLYLNDSLTYTWQNVWSKDFIAFNSQIGFSNSKEFQSFIEKNRLTKIDLINNDSSLALKRDIEFLSNRNSKLVSQIIPYGLKVELTKNLLITLFIIFFVLRYLMYAIKWSFQTLRSRAGR